MVVCPHRGLIFVIWMSLAWTFHVVFGGDIGQSHITLHIDTDFLFKIYFLGAFLPCYFHSDSIEQGSPNYGPPAKYGPKLNYFNLKF